MQRADPVEAYPYTRELYPIQSVGQDMVQTSDTERARAIDHVCHFVTFVLSFDNDTLFATNKGHRCDKYTLWDKGYPGQKTYS